ncbi:MAG: hypothetical protein RLY20_2167 [Verrucomicrobiota bacterium]|jgi:ABC-type antimicrobial peptide transport system permease subunit
MKLRTLTKRSLRFHWRSHLGVVIGAAIGSAALIGALIVGDSVKGSLRERAFERLGLSDYAMTTGNRFVGEHLSADIHTVLTNFSGYQLGGRLSGIIDTIGTATVPSGEHRANLVHVIGLASGGSELLGFKAEPTLQTNEVWLNHQLAAQLGVKRGDAILLRVKKGTALSGESPLTPQADSRATLRVVVRDVVGSGSGGNFSLTSGGAVPFNAFVNLATLQTALDARGSVNTILMEESSLEVGYRTVGALEDWVARKRENWFGVRYERAMGCGPTGSIALIKDRSMTPLSAESLEGGARSFMFRSAWQLRDAQLDLRLLPGIPQVELRTERVFLDTAVERAVHLEPMFSLLLRGDKPGSDFSKLDQAAFISTNWPSLFSSNAQPILTYLANLITVGTNATPYSMVTAAGAPWTLPGLRDDEIVISQWLADDLRAKPGDALALVYFDPESGARLTERTNIFRVHSIVPMQMPWADRSLMPQFPGIEKAETTAEWDTAFPLVHKIRPQDDDYWTQWRGTPKAFITLAAGQKLWANRFGNLTAIRFPIPTNSGSASSWEGFSAALKKKILATLKPEELGLRFEPVREQALKSAEQSQDFGGLFIGFSMFVIVAALLLMAMLFQFSLEQRAAEIGTLLALGFTPKQVRRLFLREGAALAFIGGLIGTLGGIGYARAMLHGLTTIWRDAVGASSLKFFITPQTLLIGLFASTLVAVVTLWLALRKQAKQPARELLAGEDGGVKMGAEPARQSRGALVGSVALIGALGLVGWVLAKGDTANAGAFFGAGALVLIAGLSLLSARLARRHQSASTLNLPSASTLAARGLSRRRSRSVATAAMLASGTFLIVSIGVFRLDANRDATKRNSGTGGFALIGESTMPVVADLNTKAGRETYALNEADIADVNFVQFRVRAGDEASCLNLNRAQKPRLLGVNSESLIGRFVFTKALRDIHPRSTWQLMDRWVYSEVGVVGSVQSPSFGDDAVPAIGDAASIQWAMGKKVGDTLDYVDERGQPFKVRIVGSVANSILQGQLIIDEADFVKRFPSESGYKYFLIDAPTNRVADVSAKLSRALQDVGLELTPAPQRLAQFNAVQNTYLGTFQILGGLGLLLGSAGLGIVVLRNVLERRGELALLLAVGWRRSAVSRLVLREHLALLGLGLAIGLTAALVAVLPSLISPNAAFPWLTLGPTFAAVVANGVVWTWLATRVALRGELLGALRGE